MVSSNSIIVTREKAPAKKQAIVREVLARLALNGPGYPHQHRNNTASACGSSATVWFAETG